MLLKLSLNKIYVFRGCTSLTLSGQGDGIRPSPNVFLHNSKTPQDVEKKLSDFNFTPLTRSFYIFCQ